MIEPRALALRAYAAVAATGIDALLGATRATCSITVDRPELLARGPHVYAYWHSMAMTAFLVMFELPGPFTALCHPAWYLRQWEILARRHRWRIVMGSTGHAGRAASERIIDDVRDGCSTIVCPDGPAGPPRVAKRGVFHIAARSGAPIVPLVFELDRPVTLPTWDRMQLPLPGSRVVVRVGEPIAVRPDDVGASEGLLRDALAP
jgi:lysophospholipid acyltransferase (LPLAT)-like uncharacterized protein